FVAKTSNARRSRGVRQCRARMYERKTFATQHTEIDLRQRNPVDGVAINVDKARFALDHFSLACQFVERYAPVFFRGNHRRHLIKIAPEFLERYANFGLR